MNPATGPWWLAPTVVAASVAALVTIASLVLNGRRDRKDRHRQLLGNALGEVYAYEEFPFIVRRRQKNEPEAERARITAELSEVQRRLNLNQALLWIEAPRVALAYGDLVGATRRIAGRAIRRAWDVPGVDADGAVPVEDVDLSAIEPYQRAFLVAASDHLAIAPWWLRAAGRQSKGVAALVLILRHRRGRGGAGAVSKGMWSRGAKGRDI
jgi:hypothetical protein